MDQIGISFQATLSTIDEYFEIVKFIYSEQLKFHTRKGVFMSRAFNKDAVEGFSRSKRLLENGDFNFEPTDFRYKCIGDKDSFTILFEKLKDDRIYAKIIKFIGFDDSFESQWETRDRYDYTLSDFKVNKSNHIELLKEIEYQETIQKDHTTLLAEISNRFQNAQLLPTDSAPIQNLIYYTIGLDSKYKQLLCASIRSMSMNTSNIPDILLIHDCDISDVLSEFQHLNIFTQRVPQVKDGIEASMNKLLFFDWPLFANYRNVLYLDADTIIDFDINRILDKQIDPNILYSTIHSHCPFTVHQTFFHTIKQYTSEQMCLFESKGIYPFNAGQFMFRSGNVMKAHFDNIRYLISKWKFNFFFEQSFMNYYFNSNLASDTSLMSDDVLIYYIGKDRMNKQDFSRGKLIHYAGDACEGQTKVDFLTQTFPEYI